MLHKIAKFIVKNNFKITFVTIIISLIFQFKQLIFSPVINLYDKIPSLSQTYDTILSIRNPFQEIAISAKDEIINSIKSKYAQNKYSELALLNISFLTTELLNLQEENPLKYNKDVDIALAELNQFKYNASQKIFDELAKSSDKNLREKYLGLSAINIYFSDKIEAINLFNKGLKVNPNNIFLLNNLGRIYSELESYENAKIVYNKIINLGLKEKNDKFTALGYSNLGVIALKEKSYPVAFTNFNKALNINQKIGMPIAEANQYANIAITYAANKQIDKACINLRKARIIYYKNYLDDMAKKMSIKLKDLSCH